MSELSNSSGSLNNSLDALIAGLAVSAAISADDPEVWWGSEGIVALCWADGVPYKFEEGNE